MKSEYLYGGKELQTLFGIRWYDSSARYQTTDGLFSGIDPYAIFSVYDRNQNLIYKTVVRVQGVGGRDQSALSNTQGCIRIADDDILELKMLTESLEKSDPLEEKGILQVANDLESPVNHDVGIPPARPIRDILHAVIHQHRRPPVVAHDIPIDNRIFHTHFLRYIFNRRNPQPL